MKLLITITYFAKKYLIFNKSEFLSTFSLVLDQKKQLNKPLLFFIKLLSLLSIITWLIWPLALLHLNLRDLICQHIWLAFVHYILIWNLFLIFFPLGCFSVCWYFYLYFVFSCGLVFFLLLCFFWKNRIGTECKYSWQGEGTVFNPLIQVQSAGPLRGNC